MRFGRLLRLLESAGGVFVRLAGKFMGSECALAVRGSRGSVGVGGQVVVFSGSIVNAL